MFFLEVVSVCGMMQEVQERHDGISRNEFRQNSTRSRCTNVRQGCSLQRNIHNGSHYELFGPMNLCARKILNRKFSPELRNHNLIVQSGGAPGTYDTIAFFTCLKIYSTI